MSEWQTPKTDWSASQEQGVSGADFNRIEGNAEYLYENTDGFIRLSSSSMSPWEIGVITSGPAMGDFIAETAIIQRAPVLIPPSHKVLLMRANWWHQMGSTTGITTKASFDLTGGSGLLIYNMDQSFFDTGLLATPIEAARNETASDVTELFEVSTATDGTRKGVVEYNIMFLMRVLPI